MKKHLATLSMTALMIIGAVTVSVAQPPPGGGPQPGGNAAPNVTPIDGGVGLLVAAGFVYGGAKLARSRRRWA